MSKRGKKQNKARRALYPKGTGTQGVNPAVANLVRLIQAQLAEDQRTGRDEAAQWLESLAISAHVSQTTVILGTRYSSENVRAAITTVAAEIAGAEPQNAVQVLPADAFIDTYEQAITAAPSGTERLSLKAGLLLERARCQLVARRDAKGVVRVAKPNVRVRAAGLVAEVDKRWDRIGLPTRSVLDNHSVLQTAIEVDERKAMLNEVVRSIGDSDAVVLIRDVIEEYLYDSLEDISLDRFARCLTAVNQTEAMDWALSAAADLPELGQALVQAERDGWPDGP